MTDTKQYRYKTIYSSKNKLANNIDLLKIDINFLNYINIDNNGQQSYTQAQLFRIVLYSTRKTSTSA